MLQHGKIHSNLTNTVHARCKKLQYLKFITLHGDSKINKMRPMKNTYKFLLLKRYVPLFT